MKSQGSGSLVSRDSMYEKSHSENGWQLASDTSFSNRGASGAAPRLWLMVGLGRWL